VIYTIKKIISLFTVVTLIMSFASFSAMGEASSSDGLPAVTNVRFMVDNTEIFRIPAPNTNVSAQVYFENKIEQSIKIIMVAYADNTLEDVVCLPATVTEGYPTVSISDIRVSSDTNRIAVMVWKSIGNNLPLCPVYELTESVDVQKALSAVEPSFQKVIPWLANMYDADTGGFHMAKSGKDDPDIHPGLEMTSWGIEILHKYSDCFDEMPEDTRQKFISFYNDRQDPTTGYYIDLQGPTNDRETARNQTTSLTAMKTLGAKPLYPHPLEPVATVMSLSTIADESVSTASTTDTLPEYMASAESYVDWIEELSWSENSWTAGDRIQASQVYIKALPSDERQSYLDAMFDWLEENQNPQTGLWNATPDYNAVSGAFKIGLVYQTWGRQMPDADKILQSIISCYQNFEADSPYYIRNPISLLQQIAGYDLHFKESVRQAILDNIGDIVAGIDKFKCPDGAFSAGYQKSMKSFGGVVGSHELYEGDIDATLMVLITRNALYNIFDLTAPPLASSDFWNWITGEKEMPSPYDDEAILNVVVSYDFENYDLGYKVNGTEFSANSTTFTYAQIVEDSDKKDNNVLFLSYDGLLESGPYIDFTNITPEILYQNHKKVVTEYDVKVKDMTGERNFYVHYGKSPSFAISSSQAGAQKINYRVATNMTAYGSPLVTMNEDEWYNFRAEYEMSDDGTDATIKFYVNEEPVSETSNYFGVHLGDSPVAMNKTVRFLFYKAGAGKLYIDNVKIYSEE